MLLLLTHFFYVSVQKLFSHMFSQFWFNKIVWKKQITAHCTHDKTFITHHLKNESKLWLHSSLISHGFLLQRHGNCLTQFHKLLVLTCCTQLLWVYAQIQLQVLRYKFERVSFLQKVQKLKRSWEGHKSAIAKQRLVKHIMKSGFLYME